MKSRVNKMKNKKRLLCVLLAVICVSASVGALCVYADENEKLRGDVNGDGYVDVCDCVCICKMAAGEIQKNYETADINYDGVISDVDAQILAEYIVNIRECLPEKETETEIIEF